MRTGLTNNRNVLTATTHRSTATPVYLQYPKYVAGVERALHMAYKHLICIFILSAAERVVFRYNFQVCFGIAVQNQVCISKRVIVDQIIQL